MGLVAYLVLIVSVLLAAQAAFSLYLMLYTWEHPERLEESSGPRSFLPPQLSFTVLLPARHEEAVIYQTIRSVWAADYPQDLLEIAVICSDDDVGTIAEAQRAVREICSPHVRVETFSGKPINKPRGLNVGFGRTTNEIVTIFDAEDDIDPDIFNVINTVMLEENAGVVQSGVQLMNFRDHWFSVHNCLEYFFWFKSRLHFHAKVGMIPLGGNTVFMRRDLIERVGGWAEDCLTEDAEIGLRISALGEKIRVVYHAQHVTREETPDTVASFVKQRTRWHQGFLQILRRGSWLGLSTLTQKLLALYTLSYSVFQGLVMLLWPVAILAVFFMDVPVGIAMVSFIPLYALLLQLVVNVAGMFAFAKEYKLRYSILTPVAMTATFIPFQFLLGISAVRAMYREARNENNWEKTAHLGAHRRPEIALPSVYESLLDDALGRLGAERGSVMVLDDAGRAFTIESSRGLPDEVVNSTRIGVGQGVAGWVAERALPVVINGGHVPEDLDARLSQPDLASSIVAPLRRGDEVVAVLSLSSSSPNLGTSELRWLNERLGALSAAPELPTVEPARLPERPARRPVPRKPAREPAHKPPRMPTQDIPSRENPRSQRPASRPSTGADSRHDFGRGGRSRSGQNGSRRRRRANRRRVSLMSALLGALAGALPRSIKLPPVRVPSRPRVQRGSTIVAGVLVCLVVGATSLALARNPEVAEAITAPVAAVEDNIGRVPEPASFADDEEPAEGPRAQQRDAEPPGEGSPAEVARDEGAPAGDGKVSSDDADGEPQTSDEAGASESSPPEPVASVECESGGTKCLVDLAAREMPEAEYVGGRIEIDASGLRRNYLYFEDPSLENCESIQLDGPTDGGASEYVMMIVGEDYFSTQGAGCIS